MSLERCRADAHRWLFQAKADLKAAGNSLKDGSHEWACFQSQQAGEKALKAVWYFNVLDPWGHSLVRLIQEYPEDDLRDGLALLMAQAKRLDKLYIPTRHPNGLPDLTPSEVYTEQEGEDAISSAQAILEFVEDALREPS